jgi:hypothetical protein
MSLSSASHRSLTRRNGSVRGLTQIDLMRGAKRRSAVVIEHLKYQLTGLVEGQYTFSRMIDLAKDQLATAWMDDLTPEDAGELDSWLKSRIGATSREVRLRWGFIRGLFDVVRDEVGSRSRRRRRQG